MVPAENQGAAMAGTINIGSGEHAARVLALMEAIGADDPLDVDAIAAAIVASIELGGGDSIARQDRPKGTWFVVVGGVGSITSGETIVRTLAPGDTAGEMSLPSDSAAGGHLITADRADGMVLLEMDGSVVAEPVNGLGEMARAN